MLDAGLFDNLHEQAGIDMAVLRHDTQVRIAKAAAAAERALQQRRKSVAAARKLLGSQRS